MNIMILTDKSPPEFSGAGRRALRHAETLKKRGHQVTFFTTSKTKNNNINIHNYTHLNNGFSMKRWTQRV